MAKLKKPFWKSKTFWVNVLGIIVVVATNLKAYLTTTEAVTIWAVVNIILRAVTKEPISWK